MNYHFVDILSFPSSLPPSTPTFPVVIPLPPCLAAFTLLHAFLPSFLHLPSGLSEIRVYCGLVDDLIAISRPPRTIRYHNKTKEKIDTLEYNIIILVPYGSTVGWALLSNDPTYSILLYSYSRGTQTSTQPGPQQQQQQRELPYDTAQYQLMQKNLI